MRILGPGVYFPFDADFKDLRKQYDKDSADVATLRSYGARFGKGVAVEPGITNVETQSDFQTLMRGWNGTDGDNNIGGTALSDGWRRGPKMGPTTANTQVYHQVTYNVTPGDRYTQQVLFRFDGSKPTFDFNFFYAGASATVVTPVLTDMGKGVWHAMAHHLVPAGATSFRGINLINLSWGTSTRIDLLEPIAHLHAGVQAGIALPLRTSHVWGTRAGGLLKYPGWLLPRREGTISCWIRPNYDYVAAGATDDRGILAANLTDPFQFWIGGASGTLFFQTYSGGGLQINLSYAPTAWKPEQLHHVACTWSDVEQVLYYNGVRRATHAGNVTRWGEHTWVSVGQLRDSAADWLDGLIDDLVILPRQLTDAQVALIYA